MAGSFKHITNNKGELLDNPIELLDNLGDAHEAIEEMYDMIEYLSNNNDDDDKKKMFEAYLYHLEKRGARIEYAKDKGIENYFPKLEDNQQ